MKALSLLAVLACGPALVAAAAVPRPPAAAPAKSVHLFHRHSHAAELHRSVEAAADASTVLVDEQLDGGAASASAGALFVLPHSSMPAFDVVPPTVRPKPGFFASTHAAAAPGVLPDTKNLLELVASHSTLSTLAKLVNERDAFVAALSDPNADLTVFAPSDEAFDRLHNTPPSEAVTEILLYHIVNPAVPAAKLVDGALLTTAYSPESLGGRPQKIRVITRDGIIRLNWHSNVEETDLVAKNGVVHVIDRLLFPPPNAFWVVAHLPLEFAALTLALKRAELSDAVKTTPAITVFAPTNKAFAKLGLRRLAYLFSEAGREKLVQILEYHVSPALVYSPDIIESPTGNTTLPTLLKGKVLEVAVKTDDDDHGETNVVEINGESHVIEADGIAGNGVLHAIDTVLLPFEWSVLDTAANAWFGAQVDGFMDAETAGVLGKVFAGQH
ncbi:FAS1 domain-containing protein [Entophlyctis helioformis]|nr:FAS1 domain-containing protein [Entophlyctis helioformis]